MSHKVMRRWSWEGAVCRSELEPTTRHVLLTLGTFSGAQGQSIHPSVRTLAMATGLGERTVRAHLKKAHEAGWIDVEQRTAAGGRQTSNSYHLTVPDGAEIWLSQEGAGAAGSPGGRVQELQGGGAGAAGGRGSSNDPPTTLNRPDEQTSEDGASVKKPRKKKRTQLPDGFRPSANHLAYCMAEDLEVEEQLERFKLYHQREGTLAASWNASFSLWLRNAVDFRERDRAKAAESRSGSGAGTGGFWE